MNNHFEQECQALAEKIIKQQEVMNTILTKNNKLNIIPHKDLEDLKDCYQKNDILLHKLQSKEFEIAIVGLEKAGKSTFANALIESNILPSAPERCTFTSTRLIHGNDEAKVTFYTEHEFNDIFINLLKEINYPIDNTTSFHNLSVSQFERYFENLEQKDNQLYKNHVGKTDEEIKDILKYRKELTLTGETKGFNGNQLEGEEFQSYIRGQKRQNESSGLSETNTARPRSVKKIEIASSKLKQLSTAIIYDVPGFDSPTKIHIRQTEERLKNADAIIMVTNVGRNPSIVGTSLSVINKNTDEDGIHLRDKLFVFGNQLDTANSEEQAQGNEKILKADVEKYKIGTASRVFVGSALKYLTEKNIAKDKYHENYAIDSGIDAIRTSLINYYETERFEVLKRRIDKNHQSLLSFFEKIIKHSENTFANDNPPSKESEKNLITREESKRIEKSIKEELEKFKYELKIEIFDKSLFSKKFAEDIQSGDFFTKVTEYDIEKAEISCSESITNNLEIERINNKLRESLHKKFLQDFCWLIKNLTNEKSKEIEIRLLRIFTNAVMGHQANHDTSQIVETQSKKVIQKITGDIAHNDDRFDYLIERFSRNIFDILMAYPLGGNDRLQKFNSAEQEFKYLDSFFNKGNGELINIILTQNKSPLVDSTKNLESVVHQLYSAAKSLSSSSARAKQTTLDLEKMKHLFKGNVVLGAITAVEILKDVKTSKTKTNVLNEINQDIDNLILILQQAVIPAINLELAFLNGVDKQIKRLINSTQDTDSEHARLFNRFIANIIPVTKKSEIDNINERIELHQLRIKLLDDIKNFK
ncbi:dynamin family protein [Moraxella sp. VT-16-12]|uniref:dynamin family protein n=1 Tax=Moraxella sp. VT-16-12 TaxID=2014877 RepID=UPI001644B3F8|nr:dynamin family protein [Moraxella sp. VT-16-12]